MSSSSLHFPKMPYSLIPRSLKNKLEIASTTIADVIPRSQSQRPASFGPDVPSAAVVLTGLPVLRPLWMEWALEEEVNISGKTTKCPLEFLPTPLLSSSFSPWPGSFFVVRMALNCRLSCSSGWNSKCDSVSASPRCFVLKCYFVCLWL